MKATVLARKTTDGSRDERNVHSRDFDITKAQTEPGGYYRTQSLINGWDMGLGALKQEGHSLFFFGLVKAIRSPWRAGPSSSCY